MLRIAHLSDLHIGHVSANLVRIARLVLPKNHGEGAWDIATRLLAASWFERRSVWEPLLRSTHLTHKIKTRSLVAVVQSAREHDCEHIILTGDIANLGALSEMLEAKLVFRAFGYEERHITVVPGNHDVINFQGVVELGTVMGKAEWPHVERISDDVVVLALDSTAHGKDLDWRDALSMNARGLFSEQAIEKADRLLASVPEGKFKILCCHHHLVDLPPDGYVDEWSGKIDRRLSGPAMRADELLDVAQKHGVGLILFGHRHRATHHLFTIRGIPAACSGAVTQPDRQGRLRFRIFDFEGPRIRRRRWIDAFPQDASHEVVMHALQGVSSVKPDDEIKLTQPLTLGHVQRDVERVLERSRKVDRKVLARARDRLSSKR